MKNKKNMVVIPIMVILLVAVIIVFGLVLKKYNSRPQLNADGKELAPEIITIYKLSTKYDTALKDISKCIVYDSMDTVDKYRVIHDFLVQYIDPINNTEDASLANPETCLQNRQANSRGFAALFADLCEYNDLEVKTIEGKMYIEGDIDKNYHWNAARIYDTYYHVDAFEDARSKKPYKIFLKGNEFVTNEFRQWNVGFELSDESCELSKERTEPYKFKETNKIYVSSDSKDTTEKSKEK